MSITPMRFALWFINTLIAIGLITWFVVPLAVRQTLDRDVWNIERARQRLATEDTARFIEKEMPTTPAFPSRYDLLAYSVSVVAPELRNGLYCEFGVYKGGTVNFLADRIAPTVIHGFDSFEGLPEAWRTDYQTGAFKLTNLPEVRRNVRLHKGWFNETLPGWAAANPGPLAFVHMDADLYSSTKTVLDLLADRFVAGTVIQFDEFFNYPGWQHGEYKAFTEFINQQKLRFEYLGYTRDVAPAEQVAVRILGPIEEKTADK